MKSRSREGAWIEIRFRGGRGFRPLCRSREGAWIEITKKEKLFALRYCRSREGAWIEMLLMNTAWLMLTVAPARERGLK